MDLETIKAKLRKIAALAERGVGGEKDNARRLLETLLAKHGLQIEDVIGAEQEKTTCWFKVTKRELEILLQCYFRATGRNEVSYWAGRGTRKGQIGFELTKLEAVELQALWDHFGRLFRKEARKVMKEHRRMLELLGSAFIGKHDLYSGRGGESDGCEPLSQADLARLMRLMMNMESTKYVGTRRMIEG